MPENIGTARERWGSVGELIKRWLGERQDLIVQYCGLSGVSAMNDTAVVKRRLEYLCEILVDYVSAGHFEVYEKLIQEAREYDDGGLELASKIYPRISASTEHALAFNDRFDATKASSAELSEVEVKGLHKRLSELGEVLEERFELEDLLIESLHTVHAEKVA